MLAILLSIAIVIAATALLMGIYSWFWQTKARRLQAAHPGAWVRPMIRYRSFFVVVLDTKEIKLVGLTGRPRHRHPRSELVSAEVGTIRFPAASRRCLQLRFSDGDELQLMTMRRGGFVSTVPEAHSAIDYLSKQPASEPQLR